MYRCLQNFLLQIYENKFDDKGQRRTCFDTLNFIDLLAGLVFIVPGFKSFKNYATGCFQYCTEDKLDRH